MATDGTPRAHVTLTTLQERQLLRPNGSRRHAVFTLRATREAEVERPQPTPEPARRPISLALTIDRSGSMQGEPLEMAKRVAATLVDGLSEHDEIAIVIFDDRIDVLQELAPATREVKARVRVALAGVEARGSTALHEAWLTSCRMLASDHPEQARLARCYLLTDGQANVGVTDTETIASQAAGVRENAGVSTSAFGFGSAYNEFLLAPWATAGGGQFHHLRHGSDLADTFLGERDDMRLTVALHTQLEIELPAGMAGEVISYYRPSIHADRLLVTVGDLGHDEERHLIVRFSFPTVDRAYSYTARARVRWTDERGPQAGEWQDIPFLQASDSECTAEKRDPEAMHWIGLAHKDRAMLRAVEQEKRHNGDEAQRLLDGVARRIRQYAGDDADLHAAVAELQAMSERIRAHDLDDMARKEAYYRSTTSSRDLKNYRTLE